MSRSLLKGMVLTGLIVLLIAPAVLAKSLAGVSMPNTKTVEGKPLVLNGLGLREATMFDVDVYVAGLYVEKKSSSGPSIAGSEQVKQLVLKFVRDVSKSDMQDAWKDGFGKTAGSKASGEFKSKIKKLRSWMRDLNEGDKLTFTYVPEKGLTVKVGSSTKGTIEGKSFAESFFLIWLGNSPPNAGLKRGLLGK